MLPAPPQRFLLQAILLGSLLSPLRGGTARADDAPSANRPTSGDVSIRSGRTLGTGKTVLAAGIGWPGAVAEIHFAPSPRLNVGIRANIDYGSPFLGTGTGGGGGLSVPLRFHIHGKGNLDVSILAEPGVRFGEGALVGQRGVFSNDFGVGAKLDAGPLFGLRVSKAVTLTAAPLLSLGYVTVPKASGSAIAGLAGLLGIEALMSSDTLLFAEARFGYGFAPAGLFNGHEMLSVVFGVGYLL